MISIVLHNYNAGLVSATEHSLERFSQFHFVNLPFHANQMFRNGTLWRFWEAGNPLSLDGILDCAASRNLVGFMMLLIDWDLFVN